MATEEFENDRTLSYETLAPGTRISRYKIISRLGAGGMGEVYLAEDTELERKVALKFLNPYLCRDDDCRDRFRREARAVAKLDHQSIVTVHEVGDHKGRPFFAMQYIEGESLREYIKEKDLSLEEVITLTTQICEGLDAAHRAGIIHRDIKPSNIIINTDGRPKLLDFGLAAIEGGKRLTKTGLTLGTTAYMSPEQTTGKKADARSDLFSLGIVIYEMMTGCAPFGGDNDAAILHSIAYEVPPRLAKYRPDVPDGLQAIIDKALEKDVELRYQTASELAGDFKRLVREPGHPSSSAELQPSIAVLPFEDMSPDKDKEYFCDGIAEEIINALTQIGNLRVISRTSAFAFKGQHEDVREIGRKLGVRTLLEGSVRKAGRRFRITVQLIDIHDGSHLWSERYDRDEEDIFAIQDEISLAIVEKLKLKLLEEEKARLVKRYTVDPEAYNSYLKGKFFFNQRKDAAMKKSIEYFLLAIEKDPKFAPAHAGLADSYTFLGMRRTLPRKVAFARARSEAMKALEIDDTIADTHVSMANIRLWCDWDWRGSEQEYRRALELNPSNAEAHHMYAHLLELMGRFEAAMTEINHALELEPLSPGINSCAAQILYHARRYDEAIEQCHRAIEMAPTFVGLHGWLGMAYVKKGVFDRGMEILKKGLDLMGTDPRLLAFYAYACALAAKKAKARDTLDQLIKLSTERYIDSYFVACAYAGLDDKNRAFEWLNKAYHEYSPSVSRLRIDPLLDNLRSDPKFTELLEKMGLN